MAAPSKPHSKPSIKLIVGLGNPGTEYTETRHNAGFWFIEKIDQHYNLHLKLDKKFNSITGKFTTKDNQEVFVLMPQSYMNLSGSCVQAFCKFYKIFPDQILVAHDELDFPPGVVKIKQSGGAGGHNGLKDIINKLSTKDFYRLRIGIGHPRNTNSQQEVHNYVLAKPNNSDKNQILDAIDQAYCELDQILSGDLQRAINNLHS